MNVYFGLDLLITLCFAMLTLVVGGGCEEWQFGHVLPCLKDVLYGINGTYNILAGTDTETVQTFCSDGSTNRTVSCLEDLYQECGQHNGLLNIAQPQTWRNTFTGLCSNLSSHAIYSDCIVQQRDTVRHCLHNNDELLQRLLKKHTDTTQTFVMKICSYFKGITICTVNPVRDVCHEEAGALIQSFLQGILPQQMCQQDYTFKPSSSLASAYFGSVYYCCLLLLAILIVNE
ncbi:uncharacterized protein LOC128216967 isoform X1 [Mya arenaria]|uniref:uncharacterized protein LOC128216967 isoform X1 n=1 Tax=Mya arenaria TaxID=6604 RepID=UPI0022E26606|nr:uncharacterized protein LOC128216967 isoform X1 [Mya arenaria]